MICNFGTTNFGIKNLVAAVIPYSNTNKKGRSDLTHLFVDRKIAIREKGKRYIIGLFKIADFKSRVPGTDADQLDFVFKPLVAFDFAVHFVDRGSPPLTERSIHTKYFDDNHVCLYFRDREGFAGDA